MELTEVQRLLIGYLKASNIKKGMAAAIFMTLQSEDQMLEMCQFLSDNPEATGEEALDRAREIAAQGSR